VETFHIASECKISFYFKRCLIHILAQKSIVFFTVMMLRCHQAIVDRQSIVNKLISIVVSECSLFREMFGTPNCLVIQLFWLLEFIASVLVTADRLRLTINNWKRTRLNIQLYNKILTFIYVNIIKRHSLI